MLHVQNTQTGIKAMLQGFKAQDLQEKIDACKDGSCSCNSDVEMMQKITNIEVSQTEQGASITIEGDVNAAQLEPMMRECLL
jgi:hypothetical protein